MSCIRTAGAIATSHQSSWLRDGHGVGSGPAAVRRYPHLASGSEANLLTSSVSLRMASRTC